MTKPPRFPPQLPTGLPSGAIVALCLALAAPAAGQTLPLERDYPGTGPYECPTPVAPVAPTDDQRVRASQLTSDALEASILGDLQGARALLEQASEADPTSAEVAYRHGRALEDMQMRSEAILEYCRAIGLGAADLGLDDSRERLDALYEIVRARISDRARSAFVSGLNEADAGLLEEAVGSFTVALDEVPDWTNAIYNRAVVLEGLGRIQESLTDYRRYLMLTPNDVDPVVVAVSERIGMLEGTVAQPTPSPGAALVLGVVPGMGQYYTGRGISGTLVLSLAGAAVASGFLIKTVTVRCLNPVGGDCAAGDVLDESIDRPYMLPAVGAAAAITVVGAIEAFIRARGRRNAQARATDEVSSGTVSLAGPSLSVQSDRVDVNVVSLRFR